MKRIGYLCIGLLLLVGCESNPNVNHTITSDRTTSPSPIVLTHTPKPTPTKVDSQYPISLPLTFTHLTLDTLEEQDDFIDESHYINSIQFGYLDDKPLTLHVHEGKGGSEPDTNRLDGLLELENRFYRIADISSAFSRKGIANDNRCNEVCLYQTPFSEQVTYELLGSIALFANGQGLNRYVVYDNVEGILKYFDAWGKGIFVDLDADNTLEFVIQFEGLHQNFPDIRVVDFIDNQLQISYPINETIDKKMGDYATLHINEDVQPFIKLGNAFIETSEDGIDEQSSEAIYYYSNGELIFME